MDRGTQKSILFVFAFLLIMPLAFSASIERASLEWQSYEVQTIAPGKELPGTRLRLELSQEFSECFEDPTLQCGILLDSPTIGISRVQIDVRQSCARYNTSIVCLLPPFTFRTTNSSFPIVYVTQISGSVSQAQEVDITVILDSTSPTLGRIQTGICETEESCFVAGNTPTPLSVTFDDTLTSFQYKLVFIGKKGSASMAQINECIGNTCTGNITIPCTEGEQFQIEMKSAGGISSREDAQNPILPSAQPQTFTCKTKGPEILNISRSADGIAGQAVSGGSITFTARVRSPLSQISGTLTAPNMTGNASENTTMLPTTATCRAASDSTDSDQYDCTWQVQKLNAGTYDVELRVQDALGLYDTVQERVTVLRLAAPPGDGSLNLFNHKIIAISPEAINRMALDLARNNYLPYPLYVTYELQKTKGNVRLFRQELAGCTYKLPNETNYTSAYNLFSFGGTKSESHVLLPSSDGSERNRLDLQIRAAPEVLAKSDVFNVRCTLALSVAEGDTIYSAPENETILFDVRLRESSLGTPGQAFVDKIKKEEERLSGSDQEFLLKLREIRATMDGICTTFESINGFMGVMTGAEQMGVINLNNCWTSAGATCGPISAFLATIGGTQVTTETVKDSIWVVAGKVVKQMCYQANCRGNVGYGLGNKIAEAQAKMMPFCEGSIATTDGTRTDAVESGTTRSSDRTITYDDKGGKSGGPMFDVCSGIATPNVEDSFVMSALSLCVGGMIYNAGKWQDINCGYLQCLKEQSLSGSSTAVCEIARGHKMCTQFVGEVFELPFVSTITNLAENVNSIIEELPRHLVTWGANIYCKKMMKKFANDPEAWQVMACRWTKFSLDTLDYVDTTKRGFDKPMSDNAICLEALCNEEDGDCNLNYNRVGQLTEYTRYLQVNNWFVDQQKRSGGNAQTNKASLDLFNAHDEDVRREYYRSRGQCSTSNCLPLSQDELNSFVYVPPKDNQPAHWGFQGTGSNTVGVTQIPISDRSAQSLQNLGIGESGNNRMNLLTNKEQFKQSREYVLKHNVLPSNVDELNVPSAIATQPAYRLQEEQNTLINERKHLDEQITNLETEKKQLLSTEGERTTRTTNRLASIDQEVAKLNADRDIKNDELKKIGITPQGTGPDTTWQYTTQVKTTTSIEGGDVFNQLAQTHPGIVNAFKLEQNNNQYICGEECNKYFKTPGRCASGICTIDGYTIELTREGDKITATVTTDISKEVTEGTSAKEPKPMNQFGILLVNTGIQILRDKGYLNFLSISYYGDWGIDLVEQSNTYLTKEGWANNICNDFKFDINDNEDGAVYILSESNNPQPIGTFAAEIRELSNDTQGKQKEYAYLLTALIDNPARQPPSGVSEEAWAERNTYRMDMKFLSPKNCANCPQELDLINGTFELTYGGTFGSQTGPKKAIIYSPVQYTKICITFDKDFPDINGKKTYCREIRENVYERGSPSTLPTPSSKKPNTATPTSDGDGSLAGEIA